jgi:hypothetical protein
VKPTPEQIEAIRDAIWDASPEGFHCQDSAWIVDVTWATIAPMVLEALAADSSVKPTEAQLQTLREFVHDDYYGGEKTTNVAIDAWNLVANVVRPMVLEEAAKVIETDHIAVGLAEPWSIEKLVAELRRTVVHRIRALKDTP